MSLDRSKIDGLAIFLDHYNSQIRGVCNQTESRHKYGLEVDDKYLSDSNQKLYELFQRRQTMIDLIERREKQKDEFFYD